MTLLQLVSVARPQPPHSFQNKRMGDTSKTKMRHFIYVSLAIFFLFNYTSPEFAQSATKYTHENSPCKKTQYHIDSFSDVNPGFVSSAYPTWSITDTGLTVSEREWSLGPRYILFVAHAWWTGVSWQVSHLGKYAPFKTLGEGKAVGQFEVLEFGDCIILEKNFEGSCPVTVL